MTNRNSDSLNRYIKFIFILMINIILFSVPAMATNEVTVSRTLSEDTVMPGGTFTVTISLITNEEISSLDLKEVIPNHWSIINMNSDKFKYSDGIWTWEDNKSNIIEGISTSIIYDVKVPVNNPIGTYEISGTVSGSYAKNGSTFQIAVLGDNEIAVQKNNSAPVLDPIGDKTVDENTVLSFNVFATDADGDVVTYSAIGIPPGASFNRNTGAFLWTPGYSAAGTYYVKFIAHAGGLSDSETIAIVVNNVNRPPVLNPIGNKAVNENEPLIFTISARDPDGDEISYSVVGLPPGASFNTNSGVFSWTPSYTAAGDYIVVFTVSDGIASVSERITITVGNVDRPPVLIPIGSKIVDENSLLSFTVSALDPDGDPVVYSALGLPVGASFTSSGIFSWIPSFGTAGTYHVTFTAESKGLTDSETVRITVEGQTVDKSLLSDAITRATAKAENAVAGTENGHYPQSAIDSFKSAISFAEAIYSNKGCSQTDVDNAVAELMAAEVAFDASLIITIDQTPPSPVMNLTATLTGPSWILWTWTNPSDPDFSHVMVYIDGVYHMDISDTYYNVTGLAEGTRYNISILTVDTSGNINPAWVNGSSITATSNDIKPPGSVTNLSASYIGPDWIQWSWINPTDPDFGYVFIYLDGMFLTSTLDNSTNYYNLTGLSEGKTYTIGIQTVDISGNVNPELINDSAMTMKLPYVFNLSGIDVQETSITLAWETSNDTYVVQIHRDNITLAEISGSLSYKDTDLVSDTTYNYVLVPYNIEGLAGIPARITLTTSSSANIGGNENNRSKKSSSTGGRISGSVEDYENILLKDVDTSYLRKNINVTYKFTRQGNDIQEINLYSIRNSGKITSIVEILNNRSKVVNSDPEGLVYRFVNIYVGNAGFSREENIKDIKIKFKVNSSWMQDMDVAPEDIRLQRYNGNAWEVLPTNYINKTQNYFVFEATTPGFSSFAITSLKKLRSPDENAAQASQAIWSENTKTEAPKIAIEDVAENSQPEQKSNQNKLGWLLFSIPVLSAATVIIWKKREHIVDIADDVLYRIKNFLDRDDE
ncbi:MAG: PGF-pre-PGF domain-containing protein [Methanomethylovorans sp.]|nr:PGF-pre-PGF domain-containing protein [Methanomethylovorans sp.]